MKYVSSTTFPVQITLTNELKKDAKLEFAVWNQGLEAAAGGDALDAKDTYFTFTESNTVVIPIYGNKNQYFEIPAEGDMKVAARSDAEALFYAALAKDGVLKVTGACFEDENT